MTKIDKLQNEIDFIKSMQEKINNEVDKPNILDNGYIELVQDIDSYLNILIDLLESRLDFYK